MRYVACCCLALLASVDALRGEEVFVFPYNQGVRLRVDFTGGLFSKWYVSGDLALPFSSHNEAARRIVPFAVRLDWTANTLTYEHFGLLTAAPLQIIADPVRFTTGPGRYDQIGLELDFDLISLLETPKTIVPIAPAMDAYYTIGDVCRGTLPLTLTGTYTLTHVQCRRG
jgi:hypothetical protein